MKNKNIKTKTGPAPTSAGTAILEHYWNTDATKVWSTAELAQAAGDTTHLQPLLQEGFYPYPGWSHLTCQTCRVGGGALFRIFDHSPGPQSPKSYGFTAPGCVIPGPPTGVLYAVAGVATDDHSAEEIWELLEFESAPLYRALNVGLGFINGYPVACMEHACERPARPSHLPWVSFMAYSQLLHQHNCYFPHDDTNYAGLVKEWLRLSEVGGNPVPKPGYLTSTPDQSSWIDLQMDLPL